MGGGSSRESGRINLSDRDLALKRREFKDAQVVVQVMDWEERELGKEEALPEVEDGREKVGLSGPVIHLHDNNKTLKTPVISLTPACSSMHPYQG